MKKSVNILISGGGTGGHIFPAISIAQEIKKQLPETNILFVGAKNRMEMEKVPQAGFEIKGLWISGLQRKLTLNNLSFPFKVIDSLLKARKIIKTFKPNIAIGTGGFASGPTLYAASKMKIPTIIQEQNSYPGITNKFLSKSTKKICVAYDNLENFFPKQKIIKTGNPVRQDLLNISHKKEDALKHFNLNNNKKTVLVIGGSLGARMINSIIQQNLDTIKQNNLQLIWQTGKLYYNEYKIHNSKSIQTHAFLNHMDLAYSAADFIISRAGAGSISELCIVGKPTIFIPSPNVAEDHQTKNAQAVTSKNAALMIAEKDHEQFNSIFNNLVNDQTLQNTLSKNLKSLALPNATKSIVNEILETLNNKVK